MPSLGSRTTSYLLKRLVKTPGSKDAGVKSVRLAVNAFTQLTPRQRDVQIAQERWGEWVSPRGLQADGHLIYYIHGGGYFFGSPQTHRPLTTRLAKVSGTKLFALRYRLAPEHLFPAPVQDAVEGYKRLLSRGYQAERIVMAGDSAGGGLVLATLAALRDSRIALPAGAVCFSPWTDLANTGESIAHNEESCAMFRATSLQRAARQYLASESPYNPLASPLYADLTGFPPLLLQVSDTEILLADSTRLVEKARSVGVDAQLQLYQDLPHVWQIFSYLPEASHSLNRAAARIQEWTRRAI